MNKKRLILSGILILTILQFLQGAIAQNLTDTSSATDPREVIAREFNIPLDKVPTDKEELQRMYLQKEWTTVLSNNSIIGPVHNFFSNEKTQIVFQVLFAHKYELSVTFLFILILWFFIALRGGQIIKSSGIINNSIGTLIGFLIAIILAQIRLFKIIATFLISLIFKSENWWMRSIVAIVILGALVLAHALSKMFEQKIKKSGKKKKESELKQKVKEVKALTEPIKGK